jgi:hypothetical protein
MALDGLLGRRLDMMVWQALVAISGLLGASDAPQPAQETKRPEVVPGNVTLTAPQPTELKLQVPAQIMLQVPTEIKLRVPTELKLPVPAKIELQVPGPIKLREPAPEPLRLPPGHRLTRGPE